MMCIHSFKTRSFTGTKFNLTHQTHGAKLLIQSITIKTYAEQINKVGQVETFHGPTFKLSTRDIKILPPMLITIRWELHF